MQWLCNVVGRTGFWISVYLGMELTTPRTPTPTMHPRARLRSHIGMQMDQGLVGPIVVRDPNDPHM